MFELPERALTVRQPYATAIVRGWKDVENRSWRPGRLPITVAIHASKQRDHIPKWAGDFLNRDQIRELGRAPLGAIVGVATLERVLDPAEYHAELPRSVWWMPDQFGIVVGAVVAVDPIPCSGSLSFWRLPDDVRFKLGERLEELTRRTA